MLIFDVGAHRGEDTERYLSKGFSVVAVEASPTLAELLKRKFAGNGRVEVIHAAIAAAAGDITFYECENSVWGTTHQTMKCRNELLGAASTPITVPAMRFDELLRRYGVPHYLKVDIEGSDTLCLEALANFQERPKYISMESSKTDWKELLKEFSLFRALGYDSFQVVDQRPFQGTSGAFGDGLRSEWLSEKAAL